jgi:hypothetical protein
MNIKLLNADKVFCIPVCMSKNDPSYVNTYLSFDS